MDDQNSTRKLASPIISAKLACDALCEKIERQFSSGCDKVGDRISGRAIILIRIPKILKSSTVAALVLFSCADFGFRQYLVAGKFDRFEAAQHRHTYWHTKEYRKLTTAPDVVLIGSSLLVRLIGDGEATYLNKPLNTVKHKQCVHLEDAVEKRTGVRPSTFAFDMHGIHASDAAVVLNAAMGDKLPSTIIYTIAPRDFIDSMLVTPDATEQFQFMSKISDLGELSSHARIHSFDKLQYDFVNLCSSIFSIVKCRAELASATERSWRQSYLPALEARVPQKKERLELYLGLTPFDYPEVEPVAPEIKGHELRYDNFVTYQIYYNPFRGRDYVAQLYYLEYILKFAKKHDIKVILANMPLRKDNITAMHPGLYGMYKMDIQKQAAKHGAKFVDLYDTDEFVDDDFMDSAHLTAHGAMKLVEKMADAVAPDVAANTLRRRGQTLQVAGREQDSSGRSISSSVGNKTLQ